MPHVKEKKTVWTIVYHDRSRDPEWAYDSLRKSEHTEAEAENEADWRDHLYRRGQYDPWVQDGPDAPAVDDQLTVMEAVEEYLKEKLDAGRRGEASGWSEKTHRSDAPVLRQFADDAGPNLLVSHLQPAHLREWVYKERLAQTTRVTRWSKLCAMVRFWEKRGWIDDPPRLPGRPQRQRTQKTTITPEQLEQIIGAYDDLRERRVAEEPHTSVYGADWYPDAWRVYLYQGFRRSELLDLKVKDVDLDDEMIHVGEGQKKGHFTMIPLVGEAKDVLEPYLAGRDPGERIFRTPPGNKRVSEHFRDAVDHATLTYDRYSDLTPEEVPFEPLGVADPYDINIKTLRHSCCTYWLRQRRRLVWVNHLLRHADIDTTMNYVHLLPTDLQEMYQGVQER
jgi:integrase